MRQLKITKSITNRETASLDKYLQDIGKIELITAEQEVILAQQIRQGDTIALEKLVKANLRFVVSVAKQYQNQGLSLPDLINEGNLGLIKAAQRFDETRGFKFISYAVWWIRQGILQALAEQARVVRIPLNQIGALNRIKKESSRLEQKFERTPSNEELAEALETQEYKIEASIKNTIKYISMDEPMSEDENSKLGDSFFDENAPTTDALLMQESLAKEIQRAIATLSEKEREIIYLYYGLGGKQALTLEEIGEKYNLTRERVRQIKEKGIRRLKHKSRSSLLRQYL
ncbi:MAG TPA: RNA polymerase sigma factor RpoD/SigA [Candidatus Absconditabacterales bacterium]|nr:RNA polymerase sigma factor RpoD/SigA [Candidatus Absconditabacterales bacterium]